MLAFVALRGPATRDVLAGGLWPDTTQRQARSQLRNVLCALRTKAAGVVEETSNVVRLAPSVTVDLYRYRNLARDAITGNESIHRMSLEDVCGAELLPGFDDDWLELEQEKVRQLRLHALEAFSRQSLKMGMFGMALEAALTAVSLDPLRESAATAVIDVHLQEANFVEAQKWFTDFSGLMERELGVQPSTDLRAKLQARRRSTRTG